MTARDDLEIWRSELVAAALIGADRRRPPQVPPALGLAASDERDARTNLLDQAALHDVLLRAGRRPQPGEGIVAAPSETRATVPAAASELLGVLLAQPPVPPDLRLRLIRLWLDAAARNDLIVPPRLLPALLELARNDQAVGVALESAWGSRGAWLADLMDIPTRAVPASTSPERLAGQFPTLDTATAAEVVRHLRQSDPAAARDLLAAQWKGLPARTRRPASTRSRTSSPPPTKPFSRRRSATGHASSASGPGCCSAACPTVASPGGWPRDSSRSSRSAVAFWGVAPWKCRRRRPSTKPRSGTVSTPRAPASNPTGWRGWPGSSAYAPLSTWTTADRTRHSADARAPPPRSGAAPSAARGGPLSARPGLGSCVRRPGRRPRGHPTARTRRARSLAHRRSA